MKKSLISILLLLVSSIVTYKFLYHTNLGDVAVSYKLKYQPSKKNNEKFDKKVNRWIDTSKESLIDHHFQLNIANARGDMKGKFVEIWYDGKSYLQCAGSDSFTSASSIPLKLDYRTIIYANSKADSLGKIQPIINVQTFDYHPNIFGQGRNLEIVMPADGEFKLLDESYISYEEDAVIPVMAYFTPSRFKDDYKELEKIKPLELEELSMQDFIDTYVKRYDGFVLYMRCNEMDYFFCPLP